MLELQKFLLEKDPTRLELLKYVPNSKNEIKICVYRNHSFEIVEHTIGAYLDFSNLKAKFVYSDYDDSLSFLNIDTTADLLIIWLDISRYKTSNVEGFISERISTLRKTYKKPIIFAGANAKVNLKDDSVVQFDFSNIEKEMGQSFLDERLEFATGTKLSGKSLIKVSKELGLKYIPAIVKTPLKAIVVDLDNTLYKGVLGEDGINGIELTEGHKLLQAKLKEKAKEGWFLCVISKNNADDVNEMFEKRSDFPLHKEDFTAIEASWDSKPISMGKIIKKLNIGIDSVLFIDDNMGELAQMVSTYPSVKVLHALDDAKKSADMLAYYPGLLKFGTKMEDAIRSNDTKANEERQKLQESLSPEDYIKSLEMRIEYFVDDKNFAPRISELANKTNQFIFSYKRYDLPTVEKLMESKDAVVISATLSDKLSESGTIAVCVGKKEDDLLVIEECFVSCRALGRGIDDVLVLKMYKLASEVLNTTKLKVNFTKGERNLPAEKFIETYLDKYQNKEGQMDLTFNESLVNIKVNRG